MQAVAALVEQRESLKTTLTERDQTIAAQKAEIDAFKAADAARAKAEQRRATADAILEGAHPNKRDELGLLVDGLAARGEIDLDNPDKAAEHRESLAKKYPGYFQPVDGAPQQGVPGPQGLDLSGMRYEDLTPEMRASLTPEQRRSIMAISTKEDTKLVV